MADYPNAERLIAARGKRLGYADRHTSFSPFHSDIGVCPGPRGIACLFLHYNKTTVTMGEPFLDLGAVAGDAECSAVRIAQQYEQGSADIAFYDHNSWVVDCRGVPACEYTLKTDWLMAHERVTRPAGDTLVFDCSMPTADKVDGEPDQLFPLVLGLRVVTGTITEGDGIAHPLCLESDDDGRMVIAFSLHMLEVDHARITQRLGAAPDSAAEAVDRTKAWMERALDRLAVPAGDTDAARTVARAAYTLLSISAAAPGMYNGRIGSWPNRGAYARHFLWDACFHAPGLEKMETRLAEDALLVLTENMRCDGKIPEFICSTWMFTGGSQSPLIGWAGLQIVKARDDMDLAQTLIAALRKNTRWWLEQRMTQSGLIYAYHGYETGADNSPRLDPGPSVACDMNAYLLNQMRSCAEMARMIGDTEGAAADDAQADAFGKRIIDYLYDEKDNIFYDRIVQTGRMLAIKTPAAFLPLWAGVPLPEDRAWSMIEQYLLNGDHFFGPVPFPSVAYDEPTFDCAGGWRGSTWPPNVCLMVALLKAYGYEAEWRRAMQRYCEVVEADGAMHEFHNSITGEPMGKAEQGWTAAVYLKFRDELEEKQ